MFKKIAFGGLGLLVLVSPLIISAQSTSDSQAAAVANLVSQVEYLKAQVVKLQPSRVVVPQACTRDAKICPDGTSVGRSGPKCTFAACPTGTRPPSPPPPIKPCLPILRSLQRGSTGAEVTKLQNFLIQSGNLDIPEATGFFGAVTEAAVEDLQVENDVVSPNSAGSAAGLGKVGPLTRAVIAAQCGNPNPKSKLVASPKSGTAPLRVTFSTTVTPSAGDTLVVDFGDGESGRMQSISLGCPVDSSGGGGCTGSGGFTVSHTYDANGTYTAKLTQRNPGGCGPTATAQGCLGPPASIKNLGSAVIRVGKAVGSGAPSISKISGPTTLATGKSGTWRVNATAGSGGSLSYSVIWGDEEAIDQIRGYADAPSRSIQSSATFTHTYYSAGTYKPRFTVSNSKGSAKASINVIVGGSTITPPCCKNDGLFSASPKSGSAPLAVSFTVRDDGTDPGRYQLNFGDGATSSIAAGSGACAESFPMQCTYVKSHTYTSAGTYTAKLIESDPGGCGPNADPGCLGPPASIRTLGTQTITVSGTVGAPSITGLTAPTSLLIGQSGTWTVHATSPSGGNLSYSVVWGDEPSTAAADAAAADLRSTATFTHSYASVGTYTPRFKVSNSGGSSQTSASVTVTNN
ncbi:MAG: hypothetical protein Q7S50_02100 [bacterium]|nr:hypothetical protein [bacterium]